MLNCQAVLIVKCALVFPSKKNEASPQNPINVENKIPMETNQPLLCMSANVWAWCVCITLIWATSVKQHFHSQNSIFLSVWILFCWGDIALWWSHRSQSRYVIWVTLAALWGLCLAAGWLKPSVPSQAWINQAAADEKWGRGREKVSQTDTSYKALRSFTLDVWPDVILKEWKRCHPAAPPLSESFCLFSEPASVCSVSPERLTYAMIASAIL